MKFVIAYDIQNDKNRKKLSDILEGIGYRVNFSVFECEINETKLKADQRRQAFTKYQNR